MRKEFEDIEFHGAVEVKHEFNADEQLNQIKKYVAKLDQSGTADPEVTVFENSLGGVPVWTRSSAGSCLCTLAGAFLNNKVISTVSQDLWATGNVANGFREALTRGNDNSLTLKQYSNTLVATDGFVMYVEITVYP